MIPIECTGVERDYRRGEAVIRPLRGLDLSVEAGEFVALMGPSGSGKTTLLNLVAGIDSPTAGSVVVGSTDLASLSQGRLASWRAAHVGYVHQLYNLVPVLTAFENVELPLLLRTMSRRERHRRVERALEEVDIASRAHHYPRQLSGGQEQRVAIARAIVGEPPLLVADEPTGDLDAEAGAAIMSLLSRIHAEHGATVVMVTHDEGCAASATRITRLHKGRIAGHEAVAS